MSDLPPAPALPAGDPAPAAPGAARSLIISGIWMTRQELIAALGSEVPLAV